MWGGLAHSVREVLLQGGVRQGDQGQGVPNGEQAVQQIKGQPAFPPNLPGQSSLTCGVPAAAVGKGRPAPGWPPPGQPQRSRPPAPGWAPPSQPRRGRPPAPGWSPPGQPRRGRLPAPPRGQGRPEPLRGGLVGCPLFCHCKRVLGSPAPADTLPPGQAEEQDGVLPRRRAPHACQEVSQGHFLAEDYPVSCQALDPDGCLRVFGGQPAHLQTGRLLRHEGLYPPSVPLGKVKEAMERLPLPQRPGDRGRDILMASS
ncbi:calcium-binding protein P-like [Portunus trituberculatus]|uniref:calcium-binding protein P-like n=1 Tax=Portunus trituberculatus TaxID=210409 RepID=UPI001E1D1365|nr:calcium-binding protein P-like [Portunus trituberculatus]